MERLKEAETAFRESLGYDATLGQTHYHLARTLEKEERAGDAIQEYEAAVRIDAGATDACYSLATLYKKLGQSAQSEKMFAEYRRRKEASPAPDITKPEQPR